MKTKSMPDLGDLRERATLLAWREHSRFEFARQLARAGFGELDIGTLLDACQITATKPAGETNSHHLVRGIAIYPSIIIAYNMPAARCNTLGKLQVIRKTSTDKR